MTKRNSDVVAWAREQAGLLRARRFADLDLEAVAEEIDDVGKSEERELGSRMAVLLAHLLKWQIQPAHRSNSWRGSIAVHRRGISRLFKRTPSLRPTLDDVIAGAWDDALATVIADTGFDLGELPEHCPWKVEHILTEGWLPD